MNFKNYTEIKDAEYVHFGAATGLSESIWKRVTPDGQEEPMFKLIYVNYKSISSSKKAWGWVKIVGNKRINTANISKMLKGRDPLDLWTREQYEEFMFTELI